MNPVAVLAMAGSLVAWLALAAGMAVYGHAGALMVLSAATVALYLSVPWLRLRANPPDRSSQPARFWIRGALAAAALTACGALAWMLAVRLGLV